MIRRKRRILFLLVSGILMIMCYFGTLKRGSRVKANENIYMIELEGQTVDLETAIRMSQENEVLEDPVAYTLWTQKNNQYISEPQLGRKSSVDVLEIFGNSVYVFPGDVFIDTADEAGCLVDAQTAYDLFGKTSAVGQAIEFDGRELTIRGILENMEHTMVVQAGKVVEKEKEGAVFDRVSICRPSVSEKSEDERFTNIFGLQGKKVEVLFFTGWIHFFMRLLPVCITLTCVLWAVKKLWRMRRTPVKCAIYTVIIILTVWLFIRIYGIQWNIPQEMIPGSWSDFDFWKQFFDERIEFYRQFFEGEKVKPILYYIHPLMHCLKSALFSVCFFILFIHRLFSPVKTKAADR